ncbi:WASH complex subunit 4 [Scaptodrosophila lebanonensis]|uniref:WASH complex subunit 4 n=1 Tax=Drosophila lebanonensis TaxID=7225 RepID=A0A6J2TXB9_DROLE|nr:WASH complex subunit 4 [Scaptodrosophila lebanonensis]
MKQSSLSMFAEDTLKNFGTFLKEHDGKLNSLRKQMPVSDSSTVPTSLAPVVEITTNTEDYLALAPGMHVHMEAELFSNKLQATLAHLCNQCKDLAKYACQFQLKFLLTDAHIKDVMTGCSVNIANEFTLFKMSCAIDFFCQVYILLKHIVNLLEHMLHQITASMAISEGSSSHVFSVFDSMIELLEHLVIFNEITEQSSFATNWLLYKKWLQKLAKDPNVSSTNCTELELKGLQQAIDDIEVVISGNVYPMLLNKLLELKKRLNLKDFNSITQHSNTYIRQKMLDIETNQSNEYRNYEEPKHVVRLTALVSVLYELGIQIDGKLSKNITELLSKYQRLALYMNVIWSPSIFLSKHSKTFAKLPDKFPDNSKQYHTIVEKLNSCDQRSCRQLCTQIALWTINVQGVINAGVFDQLKHFSKLIVAGQKYADEVNCLIGGLINRHVALMIPITQATTSIVCKLVQLLKIIQHTFASNQFCFIRFLSAIIQWQRHKILQLLSDAKKRLVDAKLLQRKMNILSMLKLAEKLLRSQHINKNLMMINLIFNEFIEKERAISTDTQKSFKTIVARVNYLSNFQRNITAQFDNTRLLYIYWSLAISRKSDVVEKQRNAYALQNIFAATNQLDKTTNIFEVCDKNSSKSTVYDMVMESLCTNLELFLRVEALSHLFLSQELPFNQTTIDYRNCISVSPTEMHGEYSILKDSLENYFSATFYNLTTIAPHDWKSYEKMRHFAFKLFQLQPVDDYLPNQIIDQGIDVLQIMRNIHTFASTYSYNMNLQLFVENNDKNKYLDIIGTRHVANSVQTHGTGIINTTVNFIYQFLRQKFYTFSTFLHDEHIKSRLLKEFRFYNEQKNIKQHQSYPYDRAESFIKKIRKLGVSNNGDSYMDLFRKVITHVGNAVGYVRLLQSGSKNANYRSRAYMSRYANNFTNHSTQPLHKTTEESIKQFEKSVGHMKECHSESTNYFKLLMQAFQPFFSNKNNYHLKNFFLITPSLIMNYIDHRVKEKLNIYKKDQPNCSLFEDGFAVGLVYILFMLNQVGEFHELAWHYTVTQQLNSERQKVREIFTAAHNTADATNASVHAKDNEDEKLMQTVAITERHIKAYESEYNHLYASLSSAEIFFQ